MIVPLAAQIDLRSNASVARLRPGPGLASGGALAGMPGRVGQASLGIPCRPLAGGSFACRNMDVTEVIVTRLLDTPGTAPGVVFYQPEFFNSRSAASAARSCFLSETLSIGLTSSARASSSKNRESAASEVHHR